MKKRFIIPFVIAGLAVFTSCKKKAAETSSEAAVDPKPAAEAQATEESVTSEKRAEKLGFARHIPNDISAYSAVINGRGVFDKMLDTPTGKFLVDRLEEEGITLDELGGDAEVMRAMSAYSEDFFVAYGPSAPEGIKVATEFVERLLYYAGRMAIYAGDAAVGDKMQEAMSPTSRLFAGPLKGLPADFVKALAEFDVPAYYQGAKASSDEERIVIREDMENILTMMRMMQVGVEDLTFERNGAQFDACKFDGEKLLDELKKQAQGDDPLNQLSQFMGIARKDIRELRKALKETKFVAAVGEIDDYVVLFVGDSVDDFVLVDDVNDSFCASDKISFIDEHLDDEMFAFGFYDAATSMSYSSSAFEKVSYQLLGSLFKGLSDQLAVSESLGDTQDIEVMLDSLSQKGKELAGMYQWTDAGYVAYFEEGIKFEAYGGSNMPSLDLGVAHTLAPMAAGEGTFLFMNWVSNEQYSGALMQFIDTLGEVTYMGAKHVLPLLDKSGLDEISDVHAGFKMFDDMFREDILEIWKALRTDMAEGLGAETAMVIDMNGTFPKVPIPQPILDEGKIPRIAYVSTVDDREKLQQSWARLNQSLESLLKKAGEIAGNEIPMQVPMSSEKDGLKTWFVPVPFQNDDFVPSISVSDDLFFASSSKNYSENLSALSAQSNGEARKGAWIDIDIQVLHKYAEQWLDLIEENAADLMSDSELDDFDANQEMMRTSLDALAALDSFTYHARQVDGQTRISVHLKTK
jgi:hypothetical protein